MTTKYSLVEFIVTWYKAGEKVYDDPYLWEGLVDWHAWPDDGKWIEERPQIMHIVQGSEWKQSTTTQNVFVPNKDIIAIIGVNVMEEGPLIFDYENIGTDVFEGFEEDIINLAKQLPEPKKNERQWKSLLTLWKCVIDCYQGYEDLYPECELIPELLGAVNQEKLKQLSELI